MGRYRKLDIILTEEQRGSLEKIVKKGKCSATEIRRANVILMVDKSSGKGMNDVDVARAMNITPQAVHDIKAKFLDGIGGQKEKKNADDAVKRKERVRNLAIF